MAGWKMMWTVFAALLVLAGFPMTREEWEGGFGATVKTKERTEGDEET